MFSNFRKRLEDGLDAVEALATGTSPQASPRLHRQDSTSSLTEASSMTSPPVRHSLDLASPSQHSPTFNYLPYQPRAAAQLADSAMSNLRRSLTLQRSASANSGQSEQERKAARASRDPGPGGSDREVSPVHAPTPRKTLATSLEERLRANFTIGEASGSPSPAGRLTPTAKAPNSLIEATNSDKPVSTDPADVPLPMSPDKENAPLPNIGPSENVEPTSVHLPMSPPPHDSTQLFVHENLVPPRNRTLSTSSVTHHPLSLPSPIPNAEDVPESPAPAQVEFSAPTSPPVTNSQLERSIHRPPNIIVDVSTPSSALVTPSDFATAESRSDITVGSPNASMEELSIDALQSSLLAVEAQATPISAVNELPPNVIPPYETSLTGAVAEASVDPSVDAPENDNTAETDTKLRDRLQVVEQRFSGEWIVLFALIWLSYGLDISTSFKRLQAEKVAADKLIKEVSSLEGLSDLDGFRDYLLNQKMKIEASH